ncbi:unnamed protein product [Amoebophrya sp. A25]|nr:unnamed protein product [Amoebophrya sp. A25]|eukprot:GSA25T00010110001.1
MTLTLTLSTSPSWQGTNAVLPTSRNRCFFLRSFLRGCIVLSAPVPFVSAASPASLLRSPGALRRCSARDNLASLAEKMPAVEPKPAQHKSKSSPSSVRLAATAAATLVGRLTEGASTDNYLRACCERRRKAAYDKDEDDEKDDISHLDEDDDEGDNRFDILGGSRSMKPKIPEDARLQMMKTPEDIRFLECLAKNLKFYQETDRVVLTHDHHINAFAPTKKEQEIKPQERVHSGAAPQPVANIMLISKSSLLEQSSRTGYPTSTTDVEDEQVAFEVDHPRFDALVGSVVGHHLDIGETGDFQYIVKLDVDVDDYKALDQEDEVDVKGHQLHLLSTPRIIFYPFQSCTTCVLRSQKSVRAATEKDERKEELRRRQQESWKEEEQRKREQESQAAERILVKEMKQLNLNNGHPEFRGPLDADFLHVQHAAKGKGEKSTSEDNTCTKSPALSSTSSKQTEPTTTPHTHLMEVLNIGEGYTGEDSSPPPTKDSPDSSPSSTNSNASTSSSTSSAEPDEDKEHQRDCPMKVSGGKMTKTSSPDAKEASKMIFAERPVLKVDGDTRPRAILGKIGLGDRDVGEREDIKDFNIINACPCSQADNISEGGREPCADCDREDITIDPEQKEKRRVPTSFSEGCKKSMAQAQLRPRS